MPICLIVAALHLLVSYSLNHCNNQEINDNQEINNDKSTPPSWLSSSCASCCAIDLHREILLDDNDNIQDKHPEKEIPSEDSSRNIFHS